ncbi:unnamed protein product, partial [Amoebophrya sp. A25]|eukprot:GSA25T00022936001.1
MDALGTLPEGRGEEFLDVGSSMKKPFLGPSSTGPLAFDDVHLRRARGPLSSSSSSSILEKERFAWQREREQLHAEIERQKEELEVQLKEKDRYVESFMEDLEKQTAVLKEERSLLVEERAEFLKELDEFEKVAAIGEGEQLVGGKKESHGKNQQKSSAARRKNSLASTRVVDPNASAEQDKNSFIKPFTSSLMLSKITSTSRNNASALKLQDSSFAETELANAQKMIREMERQLAESHAIRKTQNRQILA